MTHWQIRTVSLLGFAVVLLATPFRASAGDINPPEGPVEPTMKTLVEVEPRIAVNEENTPGDEDSLFRITESGSYYLTGNITGAAGKDGIRIDTDDVTLDLNGFALIGVPASISGVHVISTHKNIAIKNGTLSNWGKSGVLAENADNSQLSNLRASDNLGTGFKIGTGSVVSRCVSRSNSGTGIFAKEGSTVSGCAVAGNLSEGIFTTSDCTVIDCTSNNNTLSGILVDDSCTVSVCVVSGNGVGIRVNGDGNRIDSNNTTDNDRGIDVNGTGNLIIKNSAHGNTTNYDIVAGNCVGEILDCVGGGTITECNPWANFEF